MAKLNNKEDGVHTEEMQDIIGTPPRWLYRWGISIIVVVLAICFIISSLIRYPETVKTSLKLILLHSPHAVFYEDSVRLAKILVQNDQIVRKGQYLADIETSTGKYSTKAPMDARLYYAGIIHENEQLVPRQPIFYLLEDNQDYYGEMIIPQKYIYKVKPRQVVLIKPRNLSSEQSYMFKGMIKYITNNQSKNGEYLAEVDFDTLKNNYKSQYLTLSNGMIVDAEIITEETTLLRRFINNITKNIK